MLLKDLSVPFSIQNRIPLYLNEYLIGGVLDADAVLCPAGLMPLSSDNPQLGFKIVGDIATCTKILNNWINALRTEGRLRTWRNELLNVTPLPIQTDLPNDYLMGYLNTLPPPLACIERGAARAFGILTHAVHLVATTPDGNIWLQQRALSKATEAGLWDTLAGGLVAYNDTLTSGMVRETQEEAGLLPHQLLNFKCQGMVQHHAESIDGLINEAVWVYTATVLDTTTPYNLDGEVMGFACVTPETLTDYIHNKHVSYEAILAFKHAGVI
jgi:8-oxo-dGTP pyrophosphatase MutT (NUDIX family)